MRCAGGTYVAMVGAGTSAQMVHSDGTVCNHVDPGATIPEFSWLEVLASRKRQTVGDMRTIMEPIIDDLVREVLVQFTGWLVHEGYLAGPYDAALVVSFLREVRAPALPDDRGLPLGSPTPPSSAGLGVVSTRALVRELVQRGLARRLADQAGGVALYEWATQMQETLPAEVLDAFRAPVE